MWCSRSSEMPCLYTCTSTARVASSLQQQLGIRVRITRGALAIFGVQPAKWRCFHVECCLASSLQQKQLGEAQPLPELRCDQPVADDPLQEILGDALLVHLNLHSPCGLQPAAAAAKDQLLIFLLGHLACRISMASVPKVCVASSLQQQRGIRPGDFFLWHLAYRSIIASAPEV